MDQEQRIARLEAAVFQPSTRPGAEWNDWVVIDWPLCMHIDNGVTQKADPSMQFYDPTPMPFGNLASGQQLRYPNGDKRHWKRNEREVLEVYTNAVYPIKPDKMVIPIMGTGKCIAGHQFLFGQQVYTIGPDRTHGVTDEGHVHIPVGPFFPGDGRFRSPFADVTIETTASRAEVLAALRARGIKCS